MTVKGIGNPEIGIVRECKTLARRMLGGNLSKDAHAALLLLVP